MSIIGDILVIIGALIFLTAALGLIRFPDAYTRISSVGTAGGLGIIFVVAGALLHQPTIMDSVKVVIIIVLQLATSAVGTIAIARSAYLRRIPLARKHYNDIARDGEDELENPEPKA